MFFANATYDSIEYGRKHIAICSDEDAEVLWASKQNDGLLRVCKKKPIADAIMCAAATDSIPVVFECNGIRYTLVKYTPGHSERMHNKYRKNYSVRKVRIMRNEYIHVYTERCRCTMCHYEHGWDSIESICGIVKPCNNPRKPIEMDMQYCTTCGNYFIDAQSFAAYEREHGSFLVHKSVITGNEAYGKRDNYTYAKDTVLSRNGYTVNLMTFQRRDILRSLLESHEYSKAEIKDILTRFISQRGRRCPGAKEIWLSDLDYVNMYDLAQEQRVVFEQNEFVMP